MPSLLLLCGAWMSLRKYHSGANSHHLNSWSPVSICYYISIILSKDAFSSFFEPLETILSSQQLTLTQSEMKFSVVTSLNSPLLFLNLLWRCNPLPFHTSLNKRKYPVLIQVESLTYAFYLVPFLWVLALQWYPLFSDTCSPTWVICPWLP